MELPIAVVGLMLVVGIAWAAPEFMAWLFLLLCAGGAYVIIMALVARRGRG